MLNKEFERMFYVFVFFYLYFVCIVFVSYLIFYFIEIIRDSGSERGNFVDISEEELDVFKSFVKYKRIDYYSLKGYLRNISSVFLGVSVFLSEEIVVNGRYLRYFRENFL